MRARAALVLAALLCLRCGVRCEEEARCRATGPDTTPPSVSLEAPAPGARVMGVVRLRAAAADASGVSSVDFAVDGAVFATASAEPWTVTWDSLATGNGAHTLAAVAH